MDRLYIYVFILKEAVHRTDSIKQFSINKKKYDNLSEAWKQQVHIENWPWLIFFFHFPIRVSADAGTAVAIWPQTEVREEKGNVRFLIIKSFWNLSPQKASSAPAQSVPLSGSGEDERKSFIVNRL